MSNGDDDAAADAEGEADPAADGDADEPATDGDAGETAVEEAVTVDSLDERLSEAAEALDAAETEADLDDVEADLDAVEADLEGADLPEPEDEDEADPAEELDDRLADLRDRLDDERGPYAADVVETVEDASATVTETRWTEGGLAEVAEAVEAFLVEASEHLGSAFAAEGEDPEALADALDEVAAAVADADLGPDADAETLDGLLAAAETLAADLEAAEEWDDLTVREQLDAQGFYDVLESENRKDFPPEWNAIKVYEKLGDPEPILLGLEKFDSDFMEENIFDALERMGPPEAYDQIHQRAQKRNKRPVAILGKIGDERATDTLHDFIDGDGDPVLQKITLRALGEIGSEESTQPVANRLAAENGEVRSAAARALGLLGDTRAIDPLADVLADDEADEVRASAAWALNQIGTRRALDELGEYADDRSYIVQAEAEKAV